MFRVNGYMFSSHLVIIVGLSLSLLAAGCTKGGEDGGDGGRAAQESRAPAVEPVVGIDETAPEGTVTVSGGPFTMGTSEDIENDNFYEFGFNKPFFADAAPGHTVTLPTYYIDKYEVSNARYEDFLDATGFRRPGSWVNGSPAEEGLGDYPVGGVPFKAASRYCEWAGGRLPTEAEWEKAARGDDGREFPWGNEFDFDKANLAVLADERNTTERIDSKESGVSPYGAYNMTGNVWEWTSSWYKGYEGVEYESPKFGEVLKVVRGNSVSPIAHFDGEQYNELVSRYSRVYFRFPVPAHIAPKDVGFRCVYDKR